MSDRLVAGERLLAAGLLYGRRRQGPGPSLSLDWVAYVGQLAEQLVDLGLVDRADLGQLAVSEADGLVDRFSFDIILTDDQLCRVIAVEERKGKTAQGLGFFVINRSGQDVQTEGLSLPRSAKLAAFDQRALRQQWINWAAEQRLDFVEFSPDLDDLLGYLPLADLEIAGGSWNQVPSHEDNVDGALDHCYTYAENHEGDFDSDQLDRLMAALVAAKKSRESPLALMVRSEIGRAMIAEEPLIVRLQIS